MSANSEKIVVWKFFRPINGSSMIVIKTLEVECDEGESPDVLWRGTASDCEPVINNLEERRVGWNAFLEVEGSEPKWIGTSEY